MTLKDNRRACGIPLIRIAAGVRVWETTTRIDEGESRGDGSADAACVITLLCEGGPSHG